MSSFKFDKNCYVCKRHRNRKAVPLNLVFDARTVNSTVSYLSWHICSEMMKCELEYEKEEYIEYCREAKLFHFIYNHLGTKYNKLKTLKDKKTYMKELIRSRKAVRKGCKKGMLVKFVNNTYYLKGFDEYKKWFSEACPGNGYSIFDETDLEDEFLYYRNDAMPFYDVLKYLFYQYIKQNASGYKNYFDYIEVIKWVQRIF